jgi:hypothetical protein
MSSILYKIKLWLGYTWRAHTMNKLLDKHRPELREWFWSNGNDSGNGEGERE